jgi:uncharacterized membrane protein
MDGPLTATPHRHSADLTASASGTRFLQFAAGIIAIGVSLRLVQYAANRSLWVDEALLALNVVDRSLAELLQPLDRNQTAPVGYLMLTRLATALFGSSEYALRLVPLLAGCAAVPAFWVLARRTLHSGAALAAAFLFASSGALIHYASEMKQYSSDVLVTVLLAIPFVEALDHGLSARRAALLAAAGAVSVWFSQPALLVLGGFGAALALRVATRGNARELRRLVGVSAVWIVTIGPVLVLQLRSVTPEFAAYMQSYWSGAFMPFPPRSLDDMYWLYATGIRLFESPLGFYVPWIGIGAFIAGCVWALQRAPWLLLMLGSPVLLALCASALRLYPFGVAPEYHPFIAVYGRASLYLVPLFLLLVAAGADAVRRALPGGAGRVAGWLAVGIVALLPALRVVPALPHRFQEVRPLVAHLAEHRRTDDHMYIYYGARWPFLFYAPRYAFAADAPHLGVRSREEPEAYLRDLDTLRGSGRVWFLFSHVYGNEEQLMLEHLARIDGDLLATISAVGATLHLFDLR